MNESRVCSEEDFSSRILKVVLAVDQVNVEIESKTNSFYSLNYVLLPRADKDSK